MPLSKIDTAALAADSVDETILDLAANFSFSGTISGAGGGKLLNVSHHDSNTPISGGSIIPLDNSVPLHSEGTQVMAATYDPLSSTSTLIFMVHVYGNENTNLGDSIAYTLFDGTANTLIGMGYQDATNHGNGNNWNQTSFNCSYSPPDANSRVYRLRASVNHGTFESINSTTYINHARYGRRVKNSITIFEVES